MYKILLESVGFCRRCDKTFWCFFSVPSSNCSLLIKRSPGQKV